MSIQPRYIAANPAVKHCVKLRTSRGYRESTGRLLLSGWAPLQELSAQLNDLRIWTMFVGDGDILPDGIAPVDSIVTVSPAVMKKLGGWDSPPTGPQAVAEVQIPAETDFAQLPSLQRLLILEGVQDPGNLGTLMRTALALGWEGAYLLPGCCDIFNDKALRAGRGAAFKLPYALGTWQELLHIHDVHRLNLLAAQLPDDGEALSAAMFEETPRNQREASDGHGVGLVLGSEGQGLSATALQQCQAVSIPMDGDMESLNVGVAGGVLMFALSGENNRLSFGPPVSASDCRNASRTEAGQ